jgi:hypothetical protein
MTSQTSIIYLQYLNTLFPGKKIGLIWDKHSSHYCNEVLNFIHNNNKDPKNATIISELVDEGLTPIIKVPDVAVKKLSSKSSRTDITNTDYNLMSNRVSR